MTYTNRQTDTRTIKSLDAGVAYEGGWGHGMFAEMEGRVQPGDTVVVETRGFSQITGIALATGEWLFRKSDEDLDRERQEWLADYQRRKVETLKRNRADWLTRTVALPAWIRARIETFQRAPEFELEGWGYELCVAELAVIYAENPNKDCAEADAYANQHGTSGNQHDIAWLLAKMHRSGRDVAGTISALTPLTGDPDYSGKR